MPNYAYHAAEGEYPVNDQAMPILQNGFTEPLPTNRFRIDESNGGYPYHMLMPDILYAEPEPPPDPYIPESYDWLGHWFIRKNDMDLARSSVMGYISGKADKSFKPGNFKYLPHWNNSVQELNNQYYEMIGGDENGGRIRLERGDD